VPATEPGGYEQYLNSLDAVGGTNISEALLEAALLVDKERQTTIIFLTDGLATEGVTDTGMLLESVTAQMPDNARIFAFGVGDDVDTTLLDSLAQAQRGTTIYVRPGQAIDEAVSGFYAKVGSPVLTDISLDTGDIRTSAVYPTQLPDLFAGSQLVVAGRYRDDGDTAITLSGTVNGREQSYQYLNQQFLERGGESFIPRLWATRAIGHMMQQIRLHGEDEELVQSIVNLSTRYGIITPYTSFLIEEDDIFDQTGARPELMLEAEEALAAPDEVSGAQAVERAVTEAEMFSAEAPAPLPTMVAKGDGESGGGQARVVSAGDKTFFYRGGVWVDSDYDPEQGDAQEVPFASAAYFDLLNQWPEAGQYLALGEQIILVLGGQAYEIVDEPVEAVESGQPAASREETPVSSEQSPMTSEQSPVTSEQSSQPEATAVAEIVKGDTLESEPVAEAAEPAAEPAAGIPLCSAALAMPLLLVAGFGFSSRRRKR
jgi:Ca-activated chloride channel family protein